MIQEATGAIKLGFKTKTAGTVACVCACTFLVGVTGCRLYKMYKEAEAYGAEQDARKAEADARVKELEK